MKKIPGLLTAILIFPLFLSCGFESVPDSSDTTKVTINIGGSEASLSAEASIPPDITAIRCSVSAFDMEIITSTVSVTAGEALSVTLEVTNGADRKFIVEALDSSGSVLYGGSAFADLTGDPVTLGIQMYTVFQGDAIVTDTSWTASAVSESGWTSTSLDDSAWLNAEERTGCDGLPRDWIPGATGVYIWYPSSGFKPDAYLRKTFYLAADPSFARVYILAHDDYELYINGSLVGSDSNGAPSYPPDQYDVASLLADGSNTIAVHGSHSTGGCESVLGELRLSEGAGDTTPPSVPEGLASTAISSSMTDLAWTPSMDDTAVGGYKIFRNGFLAASEYDASFTDTGLDAVTEHCYSVSAYDSSGNHSLKSADTCTTTLDPADVLEGKWGFSKLLHENSGTWHAGGGAVTFNADGTGEINFTANAGEGITSGADAMTYTMTENPDGGIYIAEPGPSVTKMFKSVVSDDWSVLLYDGTSALINGVEETGAQGFLPHIRLDTAKSHTEADLDGDYYFIGYKYDPDTTQYGAYNVFSGTTTFDGLGGFSGAQTINGDGTIWSDSAYGSYSVDADGSIYFYGAGLNYISGNVNLITGSNADYPGSPGGAFFFMKTGDREYSTSDLEGTWAITGFGDSLGTTIHAEFGYAACDALGNCSFTIKTQDSDGVVETITDAPSFSVDVDGSFGAYLATGAPAYAGAIGNNGNTFIMNRSFDSTTPGERDILIGIRCSKCTESLLN
jgi:hypothetical protein